MYSFGQRALGHTSVMTSDMAEIHAAIQRAQAQAQAEKYNGLCKDALQPGARIVGRDYCGRFIVRVKAASRPIPA